MENNGIEAVQNNDKEMYKKVCGTCKFVFFLLLFCLLDLLILLPFSLPSPFIIATVSFEACSVLGHFFFTYDVFSKKTLTSCNGQKKNHVVIMLISGQARDLIKNFFVGRLLCRCARVIRILCTSMKTLRECLVEVILS